jgi:hypothetical protein
MNTVLAMGTAGDDLMTRVEMVAEGIVSVATLEYITNSKLVRPCGRRGREALYSRAELAACLKARPGQPRALPTEATQSSEDPDLITADEAAKLLRCSPIAVKALTRSGKLRRAGWLRSAAGRAMAAVSKTEVERLIEARRLEQSEREQRRRASPTSVEAPRPRPEPTVIPEGTPIRICPPDPRLLPPAVEAEVVAPASVEEEPTSTVAARWQQAEDENVLDPTTFKLAGTPTQCAETNALMLAGGIVRLAAALDGSHRPTWPMVGEEIVFFISDALQDLRVALADKELFPEDLGISKAAQRRAGAA